MNPICHRIVAARRRAVNAALSGICLFTLALPAPAADIFKGRDIYTKHCVICHGPDGRGVLANSPDFARGQGLLRTDFDLVQTVRGGRGVMPAFQGILSGPEMLDVVAYLRTFQR